MEQQAYPLVLLVDVDAEFCAWVASILALCGLKCRATHDTAEAEEIVRQQQVGCVILSADCGAAYYRFGQGVASHATRPLPVAYVTAGEADEAAMLEAHYYGGVYLMQKPVSPSQLLAWVGSLLVLDGRVKSLLKLISLLEQQATTDPLTGLFNRRMFFRRLEEELARAARAGEELGLIYVDIDHFKQINDGHGHNAGDEVLRQVAAIIERTLRKSDVVGRIGGEEFVILLPRTSANNSQMIGERLRARVERHPFSIGETVISATISAGVCSCTHPGDVEPDEFIDQADKALYAAKDQGRNRVILCSVGNSQTENAGGS